MIDVDIKIRRAVEQDRQRIASLIHYEPYVHRHLDWRSPLDWLGSSFYWVAESEQRIISALACPTDPENVAWIRLFACAGEPALQDVWQTMWENAVNELARHTPVIVPAIAMQTWLEPLLSQAGFEYHQQIVMLEYNGIVPLTPRPVNDVVIRPMIRTDLPGVAKVDAAAFAPIWQNSEEALERAYSMAGWATVAETRTGIVGYQISTINAFGAHLARLAVEPAAQGFGIGYALIVDLNHAMAAKGLRRISVNTQGDNNASLALYKKAGFVRTREEYPVYLYKL